MKFNSKRDWFYINVYILNFILAGLVCFSLLSQMIDFISILLTILLCIEIIFVSIMFFNCYYLVGSDKIKLVIGFITIDVYIKDITAINKCSNYTFSFALSGKRLELLFGKNKTKKRNKFYVSPKDEESFINRVCSQKEFKGVVDESF